MIAVLKHEKGKCKKGGSDVGVASIQCCMIKKMNRESVSAVGLRAKSLEYERVENNELQENSSDLMSFASICCFCRFYGW
jgi:hypothetical protein